MDVGDGEVYFIIRLQIICRLTLEEIPDMNTYCMYKGPSGVNALYLSLLKY